MNTRKDNQLENLDEKARTWILETAPFTNLTDMVVELREQGVMTSVPTLSRFVRRHQEKILLAERAEMKAAVEELAEGGKDGKLREGSLEAVRQRLYERVLGSHDPEEARLLYAALVKEEVRLKELELEARKLALAEEEFKVRAAVAIENGRKRAKAEVLETAPATEPKQLAASSESDQRLREAVGQALEILNRSGSLEERMLAARSLLAAGVRQSASVQ
jgi:hypothetical protein